MVEVEGEDVGHATNEVDDRHDARLKVLALYVILAAEAADELFRVVVVGTAGGVDERLHERLHDLVTAQLHVEHRLTVVYLPHAQLLTAAVGIAHLRRYVVDEATLERAVQNLLFVVAERLGTLVLQLANDACTHIHNLLVLIAHALILGTLLNVSARLLVEERQKQVGGLFVAKNLQLVRVLNVHDLIAYVVGSLHQINQRVTGVAQRLTLGRETAYAQLRGNAHKALALRAEEAKLAVRACPVALERIFHDARQHGVGHHESTLAAPVKTVREQTEGVGVALKVYEVVPEVGRQMRLQLLTRTLAEERLYGLLSTVSERRVAHVVCQTGRAHNGAELLKQRSRQLGASLLDHAGCVVA